MAKPWVELVGVNIFRATKPELEGHISDLLEFRKSQAPMVAMSVNECSLLLGIAQAELNARSSARTANFALGIALLSMLTTAGSLML